MDNVEKFWVEKLKYFNYICRVLKGGTRQRLVFAVCQRWGTQQMELFAVCLSGHTANADVRQAPSLGLTAQRLRRVLGFWHTAK